MIYILTLKTTLQKTKIKIILISLKIIVSIIQSLSKGAHIILKTMNMMNLSMRVTMTMCLIMLSSASHIVSV